MRLLELGDDGGGWMLPLNGLDVTDPGRLTRIALRAGRRDIAQSALDLATRRRDRNPGVSTLAGVADQAGGLLDGDRRALDRAVKALARGPRVLALAAALEDRALAVTTTAGASWDAGRLREQLRGLGVRRRISASPRPDRGSAGLTESELLVARLVADGLTNRETATRLHLSSHTVSMHLRHTFLKLGINSRVELARLVLENDQQT